MVTDEMLVDYLLGETTADKKQLVEQWLSESEANKAHFEQFKQIWEASGALTISAANEHEAWARFQQHVAQTPARTRTFSFTWLRAAALLLLFIGIGAFAYYYNNHNSAPTTAPIAAAPEIKKEIVTAPAQKNEQITSTQEATKPQTPETSKEKHTNPVLAVNNKPVLKKKSNTVKLSGDCKTKEFICNSTACPLEICITQKSSCEKNKPFAISNCSIIQPDQSGQLCYKVKDEQFFMNCGLSVQEVRITRVSTGETIVLNENSKPLSAQEFFNYITGKKKGEVVAGVFQSDCDNVCVERDLKLDNSYGGLLFR